MQTSANGLTKTGSAGWNAGAVSTAYLANDGYVEFTTAETNTYKMAGLTNQSWGTNGAPDLDFAIYALGDGTLQIWEAGVAVNGGASFGTYAAGDVFRVQVTDAVVTYYQNGTLLHTSTRSPPVASDGSQVHVYADAALYTPGATVNAVNLVPTPFWQNVTGVNMYGHRLTTRPNSEEPTLYAPNIGATSVPMLSGDGYVEFTTGETTTDKMAGLTHVLSPGLHSPIDFSIKLTMAGNVQIWEAGAAVKGGASFGTYSAGDVFRVQVTSGVVTYRKNGSLLYTSTNAPSFPLSVDALLTWENSTEITTLRVTSFTGTSAWKDIVGGIAVWGKSIIKTGGDDAWDSGGSTVAILNGDGYLEFTTPDAGGTHVAGLTHTVADSTNASIDFGIAVMESFIYASEGGVQVSPSLPYVPSDSFRVEVSGSVVTYLQNGLPFYQSTKVPSFPLVGDVALESYGTISDVSVVPVPAWQNAVGVSMSGPSLTKLTANGWNAGASLPTPLSGDGYVEFTTAEATTYKMAGLTHAITDNGYATIDFGVFLTSTGTVAIYEDGAQVASAGTYAPGDVFRIQVAGGAVTYIQNGSLLYASTRTPSAPLYFDASLYSKGATIAGVKLTSTASLWQNIVGATASGASLVKTASDGWDAGGALATTLSGDGYAEFTTAEATTYKLAGLTHAISDSGYATIDFGIFLTNGGMVAIYEDGTQVASADTYAAGDVFRIQISGGVVTYLQNGALLYTSGKTPGSPLHFDASLYSQGATIGDVSVTSSAPIWQNVVGATYTSTSLSKVGYDGWDGGGSLISTLSGDGYVEFSTAETTTYKLAGLTHAIADSGYATIDFGVFLAAGGSVGIFEDGTQVASVGTYAAGDVFRVQVTGGLVTYLKNGALLYTSTKTAGSQLSFDASLYSHGATIVGVQLAPAATFWQDLSGVSASGSSLTKIGNGCGAWADGAFSTGSLSIGVNPDGYAEFSTGEATTYKMVGLTRLAAGLPTPHCNTNQDLDFGIFLDAGGGVSVWEQGAQVGSSLGSYAAGDVFRVQVVNQVVTYFKNGAALYTSTRAPSFPLYLDARLYSSGATVKNAKFSYLAIPTAKDGILSAGYAHQCAVMSGGAWCWGQNAQGQLGNGTTTNEASPVQVANLSSGVQTIGAGYQHTCALVNGAVWCWGTDGGYGALGNASYVGGQSLVPVQVAGLPGTAQAITVGGYHACALVSGGVWCWGRNDRGQLGDGAQINSAAPVQVMGLGSGVQAVAAGLLHTCASADGGVVCWGNDSSGELGDGNPVSSSSQSSTPLQVVGLTSGVEAISAGNATTCAVVNGAAWCWGTNTASQLGNARVGGNSSQPVPVLGLSGGVQTIATGYNGSCATSNGSLYRWGSSVGGDIDAVSNLSIGVEAVAAGGQNDCAIAFGDVYCWQGASSPVQVAGLSGL